jgi:prolyl-tRNA synthetase
VLDENGKRKPLIMGSYGIGVERSIAAIVECHHDDKGILWPTSVAPFAVAVVIAQMDDEETAKIGNQIYAALCAAGVETMVDDRKERPGVKFRDVELIGIPLRVTVGKRNVAEGIVELTVRRSRETENVATADIVTRVQQALQAL